MEEKIIEYVNYKFRFNKSEDVEDVKAEIIANLTDRYYDLLKEGKSMQEAYVEAIKSVGSFSDDLSKESKGNDFNLKPSIADVALVIGAVLSIFGLFASLLNITLGLTITIISIVSYAGGAYYLYAYSQYVKLQELDIEKHNLILKKIFKYMKTCYIFWAISISYYVAILFASIVYFIGSMNALSDPFKLYDLIANQIVVGIIVFIIALVASLLFFTHIYNRLLRKYFELTGERYLKGKIRESYDFIYKDNGVDAKDYNAKSPLSVYIFVAISILLIVITNIFVIRFEIKETFIILSYRRSYIGLVLDLLTTKTFFASLASLIAIVGVFLISFLVIFVKLNFRWLILVDFIWLVSNYLIIITLENISDAISYGFYDVYIVSLTLIGLISLIVWFIRQRKIKKLKEQY